MVFVIPYSYKNKIFKTDQADRWIGEFVPSTAYCKLPKLSVSET